MQNPKVLLITPSFKLNGGVVEFNKMLIRYGKSRFIIFELTSGLKEGMIEKLYGLIYDYTRFFKILIFKPVDIVHVNPSLGKNAIRRDANYIRIAKLFNKKVYVHWHGWNRDNEYILEGKNSDLIHNSFFKADHIKVLSCQIEDKFRKMGFNNKLTLGNTFVDDELLDVIDTKNIKDNIFRILFLSTISINKGIYIALETYKILKSKNTNIQLTIAGSGKELENVRKYISDNKLDGIQLVGHVEKKAKRTILNQSDIYLFPSFYEGMPTSVLEAMGFGLPIVCSKVGALPDFFENEKMGFMVDSKEPLEYAKEIVKFLNNESLRVSIGNHNSQFVRKHFLASETINKIENDYSTILNHD